jgi:catechol 2,3-dioxygenase-like lactoylglutathione lyase family enzyme
MAMQLGNIVFDCANTKEAAQFYSQLTGWPIVSTDDDWIDVDSGAGVKLSFQLAPDHVPPRWPDPVAPQQAHLDLVVDDMDAEHARALDLGAKLLDDSADHPTFRVFADPAGHPFCLCAS